MDKEIYGVLKTTGICPIIATTEIETGAPAAKALVNAGLPVCEILMRGENEKMLNKIAKEVPELKVGAGSVMNLDMAKKVVDLGANFIVMPGFRKDVVDFCVKNDISVLPGCVTATEILEAMDFGLNVVKFYPVYQMGGVETLKQYNYGPFGNIEWVCTGGLNGENFLPLLSHKWTLACGGDWMFAEHNAIAEHNYEQIEKNTRKTIMDSLDYRAKLKK